MVKTWGEEYRTTLVCIDSYQEGIPAGRFYNPYKKEGNSFRGIMEFLWKMENALETMEFPKAYTTVRTFQNSEKDTTDPPIPHHKNGKHATFALKVLFRQNASWQGHVTWLEGKKEQGFRSVLELVLLINSALTEKAS